MMRCLDEQICASVAEQLEGEARAFWVRHEGALRDLATGELEAFVAGAEHMSRWHSVDSVGAIYVAQSKLSTAWRRHDPDGWRAWRQGTTRELEGIAHRRAEARRMLLEALEVVSGVAMGVIATAIRSQSD